MLTLIFILFIFRITLSIPFEQSCLNVSLSRFSSDDVSSKRSKCYKEAVNCKLSGKSLRIASLPIPNVLEELTKHHIVTTYPIMIAGCLIAGYYRCHRSARRNSPALVEAMCLSEHGFAAQMHLHVAQLRSPFDHLIIHPGLAMAMDRWKHPFFQNQISST